MTKELVKVQKNGVSGIELHAFLEVETPYSIWISRRINDYGFRDKVDFVTFLLQSTGGRRQVDHILTIDMAKELAMVERTEKGRQARRYFIEVEKQWKAQLERDSGKITRRTLTDLIRDTGENDRMHGHAYSNYTLLVYKKLGIDYVKSPDFRSTLSSEQLKAVEAMEKLAEGFLRLGYTYGQIKDALPSCIRTIEAQEVEA